MRNKTNNTVEEELKKRFSLFICTILLSLCLMSGLDNNILVFSSYSEEGRGTIRGNMLFDGKPIGKGWLWLVREDNQDRIGTLAMLNGSYSFDGLVPGRYQVEIDLFPNPRNKLSLVSGNITITVDDLAQQVPTVDVYYWGLMSPLDDEWIDLSNLNSTNSLVLSASPFPNATNYHFHIRSADGDPDLWAVDSPTNDVTFDGNLSNGQKTPTGDYVWNVQITTNEGWTLNPSTDRGVLEGLANWGTSIEQDKRATHLQQGDRLVHFFEPSDMGNLSMNTTPQGASIIIDGCMRNEVSNATVPFLSPGNHTVVLFKDALTQRQTVLIEKGNTTLLDCNMSSATTGMIIGKTNYRSIPVSMKMTLQKHKSTYGQFVQTRPDGTFLFDELPFGEYNVGSWPGAVDISFSRMSLIHLDSTTPFANLSTIDVYFSLNHPLEWQEVNATSTDTQHPLVFQWEPGMSALNYSLHVWSFYGNQTWQSDWISMNNATFDGTFNDASNITHTNYRFTIACTIDDPLGGWHGQTTTYDLNVDGLNRIVKYDGSFSEIIASEWYQQEVDKYDIIKVLDRGYLLGGQLAGTNPYTGKKQAYVYDYTQSFAAGSGNPTMMGKSSWKPNNFDFYGAFHEMGHDFQTGARGCRSYDALLHALGGSVSNSFTEAFASLSCYYITDAIQNRADHYGINENATSKLVQLLQGGKSGNYEALAEWENETAPFSKLTSVQVVVGMFYRFAETHGWAWFRQFFKIFLPADQHWSLIDEADTFEKKLTLLVLCLSAAAGTDLRDQFRTWRAPIDDDFFVANNASVYERMNRVETSTPTGLSVSLQDGKVRLSWNSSTSLYGLAGYDVYRNTSVSQNPAKINRFIVKDTEFVDNETNSMQPPSEGSSFAYSVTSVSNALEPGESNRSDTVTLTILNVPPNIMEVSQTPPENNVLAEDDVRINATVTDDVSGVKHVTLVYAHANSSGNWIGTISMTNLEEDIWNATIPALPYGTNVTYTIIAEDNVGNTITTGEMGFAYQYHVIPESLSFLILPFFMTATLLAVMIPRRKHRARGT